MNRRVIRGNFTCQILSEIKPDVQEELFRTLQ